MLGVSRSNLIDRLEQRTKARGPYRKAEDAALLPLIRAVVDERLTYGYRRVTALVNRKLRQAGRPTVNAKRVLRIMQRHALTLERHTGLPSSRTHDGKIIVLASNLRWCSDHLELHARNGEVVRVLFVIDACDREIIAWSAVANAGISGEMVRDLMIAAVERRFGNDQSPAQGRMAVRQRLRLHRQANGRNGVRPRAHLALHACPFARKQRHVGELRQDPETRLRPGTILPDAATILAKLPDWIEDYCEVHPHSGLKFRSPREFMRLSA